ncbi:MAG: hypothetical protein IKK02_03825 [Tidjanibacter sp.]|nr:hypothetical protein [Tidjanibacter sp.]MBR6813912.1 hypothetical protein [Tidjanibacter sp.]
MIYIAYIVVASLVVWFSIKASHYIDLIDQKTSLSGAFLGGVLLSAVTSLPEMFTSISATILIDKPSLCIGNILGSDLFNLTILGVLIPCYARSFSRTRTSRGHLAVCLYLFLSYVVLLLNMLNIVDFHIWTLNISTILILALYALSVKHLAAENGTLPEGAVEAESAEEDVEEECGLSLRQIVTRFVLVSLGIIVLSVVLTYITDDIAVRLNLGAGLAGAIFLGVATSLPEVSSTIALFRIGNYNIAVGNIIGSNIFNFFVLCCADLFSRLPVYDFTDPKVVGLMIFGGISTLLMLGSLGIKKRGWKVTLALSTIICYIGFLMM